MFSTLPVPYYQQLRNGYCLPACVQMVLAYWGLARSQPELAKQLQTIEDAGTPASRVKNLATNNLQVTYSDGELDALRVALEQNIPPIVFVNTGELPYWSIATAHAVVVVGIHNQTVFLNDPAKNDYPLEVPLDDFYLAWDEMYNLYALLKKV